MEPSDRIEKKHANILTSVLIFKMIMTAIWVLALLSSEWSFGWFDIPKPEPMLFVILLAGAYSALFVGYWLGYQGHKRGDNIRTVVIVGIVSNGLAALMLFLFGLGGTWNGWGTFAQVCMWFSTLAAGAITAGLVYSFLEKDDLAQVGKVRDQDRAC